AECRPAGHGRRSAARRTRATARGGGRVPVERMRLPGDRHARARADPSHGHCRGVIVQLLGELLLVVMMLGIGLRLSFFFSGSETGFYRMSLPRVSIDAQAGDPMAARLLWYSRHPARFVATTLVGNNLANYLVTFAISMGVMAIFGEVTVTIDVVSTLMLAPAVFLF